MAERLRTASLKWASVILLLTTCGCGSNSTSAGPETNGVTSDLVEERLHAARQQFEAGRLAESQKELHQVLAAEPENPWALFLYAQCLAKQQDWGAAAETASKIPSKHPQLGTPALAFCIDVATKARQLELLETKLREAIASHGAPPPLIRQLADLLNDQGRRFEAAPYMVQLARVGAADERCLLSLGTLSEPFHDEYRLQDHNTANSATLSDLAEAKSLYVQDQLAKCRELVDDLWPAFGSQPAIAAFAGKLYAFQMDQQQLRQWIQAVQPGTESEPDYWHALGLWMRSEGDHPQAARCFLEDVRRDPTDAQGYLHLAQSLASAGAAEPAARVAERYDLHRQVAHLFYEINFENGGPAKYEALAVQLDALYRPWEALGWRIAAHRQQGTLAVAQASLATQAALAKQMEQQKPQWFDTCGIDPAAWPEPNWPELKSQSIGIPAIATDSRPAGQLVLVDRAKEVSLDFRYQNNRDPDPTHIMMTEVEGGGIACFDFDLDGYVDVFFGQAGRSADAMDGSEPDQLYRNFEGIRFFNVSSRCGIHRDDYTFGVCAADINQDGWFDLLVGNQGPNRIYVNQGDGTFVEQEAPGSAAWTSALSAGDLNGDQLPDMIEINYIDDPRASTTKCWGPDFNCNPLSFRGAENVYWLSQGDGSFKKWDAIPVVRTYGFATIIANFDRQHGNDAFITCDSTDNLFWFSQPSSPEGNRFDLVDLARLSGCSLDPQGDPQGCMGVATGDFDRNGQMDLYVTNYQNETNNLLLQTRPGSFVDQAVRYGLAEPSDPMVGFGTQAVDFDRDGWLDLAVLNGHVEQREGVPFQMLPQLFKGEKERFRLVPPAEGSFWSRPALGRCLAVLDWNRDGHPDLVANDLEAPVALLENRSSRGHWLRLHLVGTQSEREAIGAEVTVKAGAESWTGWMTGGDGYFCSNEPVIDFGLGTVTLLDQVLITWPSGQIQSFERIAVDQELLVIEGRDTLISRVVN